MEAPTMFAPREVAPDTFVLPSYCPLPGLGILPVNAFVIRAVEPVLVDTGLSAVGPAFLDALKQVIDPAALKWIWISHMDPDHVGNLDAILAMAPNAKIVTTYLGVGKMVVSGRDVSRVHLLEPGMTINAGDRTLSPLRPAYFDAPETMGFFDTKTRVLFSADTFGTLAETPSEEAAAIAPDALFEGMATWCALDVPWLGVVDRTQFGRVLANIAALDPSAIISAHLPVARGVTPLLLRTVERVLDSGRVSHSFGGKSLLAA